MTTWPYCNTLVEFKGHLVSRCSFEILLDRQPDWVVVLFNICANLAMILVALFFMWLTITTLKQKIRRGKKIKAKEFALMMGLVFLTLAYSILVIAPSVFMFFVNLPINTIEKLFFQ